MSFIKKEDIKSSLAYTAIGLGIAGIYGVSEVLSESQKIKTAQIERQVFQNSVARGEQPHLCDDPSTINAIRAARKYKDHVAGILPVLLNGEIKLPN